MFECRKVTRYLILHQLALVAFASLLVRSLRFSATLQTLHSNESE
jgi:hypothetical protein